MIFVADTAKQATIKAHQIESF